MVVGGVVKVWLRSGVSEVNYILLKLYKLMPGEKEQIDCDAGTFHSASTDLLAVKHLTLYLSDPPLNRPVLSNYTSNASGLIPFD